MTDLTMAQRLQNAYKAFTTTTSGNISMSPNKDIYVDAEQCVVERVDRNKLLWDYYKGNHRKHLKTRPNGPDDNVTVNLCRRVVDKGVAFLFGEPLEFQSDDKDLLDKVWVSREWKTGFLTELGINGGVTGDFYIQIQPSTTPNGLPKLINLNPNIIVPTYNPADIDDIWAYEIRWRDGKTVKRVIYELLDTRMSWNIVEEAYINRTWQATSDVQSWPFAWCPILHGKNLPNPNDFYGLSDLEDSDLNDALNASVSNINRNVRLFAHPIINGYGFPGGMDISQIQMSDSVDAKLNALQLGNDLGGAQSHTSFLRTMHSEVTQVPQGDPSLLSVGSQSGYATRLILHELVQKTNIKRALYGREIIELNRRIVELQTNKSDSITNLLWRNPLPVDENELVAKNKFELEFGLASPETISQQRGYNYQNEVDKGAKPLIVAKTPTTIL